MGTRILQNSFLGGEIAPAMMGRVDNALYGIGAQVIENFIIEPQGSLITRPGFQYVAEAKDSAKPVRLIPFRFASDQTLVLVFGDKTMRIVTQGQVLLNDSGGVYETETPYAAEDLFSLDYSQIADIITFTCVSYPPMELRRHGATDWRWAEVTTAPVIAPPQTVGLSAVYPPETEERDKGIVESSYVVTALDNEGHESIASKEYSVKHNFYLNGGTVKISWSPVSGAERYRVYRSVAGVFGFLGETEETSITDYNDNPDTTYTPPMYASPFESYTGIKEVRVISGGAGYVADDSSGTTAVGVNAFITIPPPPLLLGSSGRYGTSRFIFELRNGSGEVVSSVTVDGSLIAYYNRDGVSREVAAATKDGGPLSLNFTNTSTVSDAHIKVRAELQTDQGWYADNDFFFDPQETAVTRYFRNEGGNLDSESVPKAWAFSRASSATREEYDANILSHRNSDAFYRMAQGSNGCPIGLLLAEAGAASGSAGASPVEIRVTDPTGEGAVLQAVVENGEITSVIVVAPGNNYTNPTLTVVSNKGSGAVLEAVLYGEEDADYPAANTQYDQRRIFAGSMASPLKVWMTNAGQQDLMMYHMPTMADDRIEIDAVTADADRIRHAVALDSLILFTGSSELRVYTQNSDALSPDSVAVRAQSYIGANDVQPVISGSHIIYAANRGGHVRALTYSYASNGYTSADISLIAVHLFDGHTIRDMTLMKAPYNIVWCVSSTGSLLGLTLYPDENVRAWHHHTTDGVFESVCCVSEGEEDRLYAVIRRTVNGAEKRYIERMSKIRYTSDTDARQLDCFIDNQPIQTRASGVFSGLDPLEGKTVIPFVDGVPQPPVTAQNGSITCKDGENVAVGLPYTSRLVTVPLTAAVQGSLQGTLKNITEIFLRVSHSGDMFANLYLSRTLRKVKDDPLELKPQNEESRTVKVTTDGNWNYQGQVEVEHRNALPLQIQAITGNVTVEKGS